VLNVQKIYQGWESRPKYGKVRKNAPKVKKFAET